jgi:hypothetical protein
MGSPTRLRWCAPLDVQVTNRSSTSSLVHSNQGSGGITRYQQSDRSSRQCQLSDPCHVESCALNSQRWKPCIIWADSVHAEVIVGVGQARCEIALKKQNGSGSADICPNEPAVLATRAPSELPTGRLVPA